MSIDILNPGQNYRLDHTIVSVSEPRGGSGFSAGTIRFEPTREKVLPELGVAEFIRLK